MPRPTLLPVDGILPGLLAQPALDAPRWGALLCRCPSGLVWAAAQRAQGWPAERQIAVFQALLDQEAPGGSGHAALVAQLCERPDRFDFPTRWPVVAPAVVAALHAALLAAGGLHAALEAERARPGRAPWALQLWTRWIASEAPGVLPPEQLAELLRVAGRETRLAVLARLAELRAPTAGRGPGARPSRMGHGHPLPVARAVEADAQRQASRARPVSHPAAAWMS